VHHFAAVLRDDHSSSPGLAAGIQQPTRGFILPGSLRHRKGSAFAFAKALSEPGQLSPPIWSCTMRGLPCPRHYCRSGGLLPHLFTLTYFANHSKMSRRFSSGLSPGLRTAGGIVSVALSVTQPHRAGLNPAPHAEARNFALRQSLRGRLPGVTRRIALYLQALRPKGVLCSRRVVSGLSSRPVRSRVPGQRSSSSPATSIISRDPPLSSGLFRWRSADYFTPSSFSNSLSVSTVTPNSFALSYFDPGSVPTTT
jgi:hypothetical protein